MCIRLKGRAEIRSRPVHWPRNALKSPINIALARNANKLSAPFLADIENERTTVAVDAERSEMEETSASVYPHRLTSLRLNRSIDRSRPMFLPFLDKSSKIGSDLSFASDRGGLRFYVIVLSHSAYFILYTRRERNKRKVNVSYILINNTK